jgi:hypothetical protein
MASLYRRLLDEQFLLVHDPSVDVDLAGRLVAGGLAVRRSDMIVPVDAATAVRGAITAAHERLAEEVAAMVAVAAVAALVYRPGEDRPGNGAPERPPVQVSTDPRRNRLVSGQPRTTARDEILTLVTAGGPPWAQNGATVAESEVAARTVIESGVLAQAGTGHTLHAAAQAGEAVRMHARLPVGAGNSAGPVPWYSVSCLDPVYVMDLNTFRDRVVELERVHPQNAAVGHASDIAQVTGVTGSALRRGGSARMEGSATVTTVMSSRSLTVATETASSVHHLRSMAARLAGHISHVASVICMGPDREAEM